jgi:LemA protein
MRRLAVVIEKYPDIKANQMYIKTMDSVNMYENQVRMSRMVYNDSVTNYNRLIRQIPSNIVASLFGFKSREYLEENEAKTEMPRMNL